MSEKSLKEIVHAAVHRLHLKRNDRVWVEHQGLTTYDTMDLVLDEIKAADAVPYIHNSGDLYLNDMLPRATQADIDHIVAHGLRTVREMQCSILLRDPHYDTKIAVPDLMKEWRKAWAPVEKMRLTRTRHATIITPPAPPLVMPDKFVGHFAPARTYQ